MAYSVIVCSVILAFAVPPSVGVMCEYGDDSGTTMSYPCSEDLCVAHRVLTQTTPSVPVTLYYCLDKNQNPHWRGLCNGLSDSDTSVIQCCLEDNCYLQLMPRLPNETAVTTSYPPYRPGTTSPPNVTDTNSTNVVNETVVSTEVPTTSNLVKCSFETHGVPLNGHPGFCYGTMCYLEKNRNGRLYARGCLNEDSQFDSEAFCSAPATESKVVVCCDYKLCNLLIDPPFLTPSPTTRITTTTSTTTENGDETTFDPIIVSIIVLVVAAVILLVVIAVVLFVLYYCSMRRKKVIGDFQSPGNDSPQDIVSSSSSEANLDSPYVIKADQSLAGGHLL